MTHLGREHRTGVKRNTGAANKKNKQHCDQLFIQAATEYGDKLVGWVRRCGDDYLTCPRRHISPGEQCRCSAGMGMILSGVHSDRAPGRFEDAKYVDCRHFESGSMVVRLSSALVKGSGRCEAT